MMMMAASHELVLLTPFTDEDITQVTQGNVYRLGTSTINSTIELVLLIRCHTAIFTLVSFKRLKT